MPGGTEPKSCPAGHSHGSVSRDSSGRMIAEISGCGHKADYSSCEPKTSMSDFAGSCAIGAGVGAFQGLAGGYIGAAETRLRKSSSSKASP